MLTPQEKTSLEKTLETMQAVLRRDAETSGDVILPTETLFKAIEKLFPLQYQDGLCEWNGTAGCAALHALYLALNDKCSDTSFRALRDECYAQACATSNGYYLPSPAGKERL